MSTAIVPTILAYADDSISDECIAVAAVIVDPARLPEAEGVLVTAKQAVGLPRLEPLHCRVMFSGDGRRGTPWEDVKPESIESMTLNLCAALKPICNRPVVCRMNPRTIPPDALAEGSVVEGLEAKGWASFGYGGIFAHLRNRYGVGVRAFMDPDRTKTPWLDGKRAQAERTRDFFMSISLSPGAEPQKFKPEVERAPKPPLLEVADLYAWATARATSAAGGRRTRWCQELMSLVDAEALIFELSEDQRWSRTLEATRAKGEQSK